MKKISFGLAALAAVVLLGEVALRVYGFGRPILFRPEPRLGWEMVPGQRAFNVRGRASVRVNSLGFRGPEVRAEKPANGFRIVFLGDGVTIGNQTPEDRIFPFLVGAQLQQRWPDRRVETLAGAVSGYQLEQELGALETRAVALRPDLVVLSFCWNDWAADTMRGPGLGPRAFGEVAGEGGWWRRVALYDFSVRLRNLQQRRGQTRGYAQGRGLPPAQQDEAAWAHVSSTLDSMTRVARTAGAQVALLILPAELVRFAPESYAARTALLHDWARAHDVLCIDPRAEFEHATPGAPLYLDEEHYAPRGHALVADAVTAALTTSLVAPASAMKAGM